VPRPKKSYAVVGLSKFGFRVATGLFRTGAEVVASDRDERLVQMISDSVSQAVQADVLDFDTLEHLGVFDVDAVIIGFRNSFDAAVLLTLTLRKRREDIYIVAQVDTDEKAEALSRVGADTTAFPERDIADRLVKRLTMPDLVEHLALSADVNIVEVAVPHEFVGKSIAEMDVRAKYHVHVIGILQPAEGDVGRHVLMAPPASTRFREGDKVLLLGKTEHIERFTGITLQG
jgi:trk system potassium uptake protein TrkA